VYFTDPAIVRGATQERSKKSGRQRQVLLKIYSLPPLVAGQNIDSGGIVGPNHLSLTAYTSDFGGNPAMKAMGKERPVLFSQGAAGLRITRAPTRDPEGCDAYPSPSDGQRGSVVFVKRGKCDFQSKLVAAEEAGAVGVIVWSDTNEAINPVAGEIQSPDTIERLKDIVLVALTYSDGQKVSDMMGLAMDGDLWVAVEADEAHVAPSNTAEKGRQILYANGHALQNTVLLF
jgi:hypothetical protein